MNYIGNLYKRIKRMAFTVLFGMVIFGCAPKEPAQQVVSCQKQEVPQEESPKVDTVYVAKDVDTIVDKGAPAKSMGEKGGQSPQEIDPEGNLEKYAAVLEVTEKINLGDKGTVVVWVGKENYMPKPNEGMARDTTVIYDVKAYALIIPHADSCIFNPKSIFMPVYKTGSSAQFDITPQKTGSINVRAEVLFYDDENRTNLPKPAGTQVLTVEVSVNYWKAIWKPVWEKFIEFWEIFVALFFGALLLVIRKFIKKKTGYSDEKNETALVVGSNEVTDDKREMPNEEEG